jgi:hypothetical protein
MMNRFTALVAVAGLSLAGAACQDTTTTAFDSNERFESTERFGPGIQSGWDKRPTERVWRTPATASDMDYYYGRDNYYYYDTTRYGGPARFDTTNNPTNLNGGNSMNTTPVNPGTNSPSNNPGSTANDGR